MSCTRWLTNTPNTTDMLGKLDKLGTKLDRVKAPGETRPFAFQAYIRKQEETEDNVNMYIIAHHRLDHDQLELIRKLPSFEGLPPDSTIVAKAHWMILFTCSKTDHVEEYRKPMVYVVRPAEDVPCGVIEEGALPFPFPPQYSLRTNFINQLMRIREHVEVDPDFDTDCSVSRCYSSLPKPGTGGAEESKESGEPNQPDRDTPRKRKAPDRFGQPISCPDGGGSSSKRRGKDRDMMTKLGNTLYHAIYPSDAVQAKKVKVVEQSVPTIGHLSGILQDPDLLKASKKGPTTSAYYQQLALCLVNMMLTDFGGKRLLDYLDDTQKANIVSASSDD